MSGASARYPDGLSEDHHRRPGLLQRHASPLAVILIGALLVAALAGVFGGQSNMTLRRSTADADLTVDMPRVIRNGEFFEARIRIVPHRHFDDLTIAVSPSLWFDLTVNSMVPAAGDESVEDGSYRFSYGPRDAGDALLLKIDFQINPSLFAGTQGDIALLDGDREVARQPLAMRVMP